MFGIGPSEMVIIGLLFLVIFGPSKLPQMARDAGRLMSEARRAMDDFKDELTSSADPAEEETRSSVKKTPRDKTRSRSGGSGEEASKENGRVSEDEEEYDL